MDRLNPCPCGSNVVASSTHIGKTAKDDYCKVSCLVCGYEVRAITLQGAEEKWNRRQNKMSTIGDRLKFMRQSKGMTQEALANKLGICRIQISEYETGRKVPSVRNLAKLADAFGTTMDFIYRGNWGNNNGQGRTALE